MDLFHVLTEYKVRCYFKDQNNIGLSKKDGSQLHLHEIVQESAGGG